MSYDKETKTINIAKKDRPENTLQDIYQFFEDFEEQIEKDSHKKLSQEDKTFKDKIGNLSKRKRFAVAFLAFWTAWVVYRTEGGHKFLGYTLYRWDDDAFLTNWLGLPVILCLIYFTYRWISSDKN